MRPGFERNTRQREAIRAALRGAGRPLSPHEILEQARRLAPGLGLATVYRNVRALTAEGWLRSVELPGAASRYELSGKEHHHHFHCRSCDGLFEVARCPGELRELVPRGFQLERHEVILYGLCQVCTEEGA
jgi:Fur family transcriptional regulator, ferric uptake regulator